MSIEPEPTSQEEELKKVSTHELIETLEEVLTSLRITLSMFTRRDPDEHPTVAKANAVLGRVEDWGTRE